MQREETGLNHNAQNKSKYCRYQEGEAVTMPLFVFVWGFSSSVLKLLSLFFFCFMVKKCHKFSLILRNGEALPATLEVQKPLGTLFIPSPLGHLAQPDLGSWVLELMKDWLRNHLSPTRVNVAGFENSSGACCCSECAGVVQTLPAGWFCGSRLQFAHVITASNKLPWEMSSQSHKN